MLEVNYSTSQHLRVSSTEGRRKESHVGLGGVFIHFGPHQYILAASATVSSSASAIVSAAQSINDDTQYSAVPKAGVKPSTSGLGASAGPLG